MGRSKRAVGRGRRYQPLSARILVLGFMSAESAVIGRRSGCMGMAMSMMTTLFCGEVSRTQMYFSDSMVTWVKVTNCGAMPRLVSVRASRMAMGALAAAMATGGGAEISLSLESGAEEETAATGGASTRI
jgi:hypothetical protein